MIRIPKSVCVQYRCNHVRPNYIIYTSNNVTFKTIVDLQWVESSNAGPADMEG